MAIGQIFKKRANDDSTPNEDSSTYGTLTGDIPTAGKAEDSIRAARTAARVEVERRIKEKRAQEQADREGICRCW